MLYNGSINQYVKDFSPNGEPPDIEIIRQKSCFGWKRTVGYSHMKFFGDLRFYLCKDSNGWYIREYHTGREVVITDKQIPFHMVCQLADQYVLRYMARHHSAIKTAKAWFAYTERVCTEIVSIEIDQINNNIRTISGTAKIMLPEAFVPELSEFEIELSI